MKTRRFVPTVLALALLALVATPSVAADFQENHSLASGNLRLANLIGEIRVEGTSGNEFEVEVSVQGRDASPEAIQVEVDESGEIIIQFPLDEHRDYVYPRLGGGSSNFSYDDDEGWFGKLFGRDRVKVKGKGSGAEMWADVRIKVPEGGRLEIHHGMGKIHADGVAGDLSLNIKSGKVEADGVEGYLTIDTGSGSVKASNVSGDLTIDTGSGSVEVFRCQGNEVVIDTGSGSVQAEEIEADRLVIDTGSGRVKATRVAADEALVDTGSGSVELMLDRMGSGDFKIDTGSGGITLGLPADASARVEAETGSGGFDVSLDGVEMLKKDQHEMSFQIGDGDADVVLDTGSGGIKIAKSR